MNSKEMADKISAIMDDRKAKNIEVIDTSRLTDVTDYLSYAAVHPRLM